MREISVREANQNFSQLVAAAERGETIIITKKGRPVAKVAPQTARRRDDPEWRAAYEAMVARLAAKPATGFRVGEITEEDKYGDEAA
ncbi:MAG: type II toxin-antitoxin system prevent-host-death family antitoxin [Caulobacter sp.]|nr:type II toxin-antitoxin system prevent-host-death family antitoxin [Caulobacter sp.]